jgi:putative YhdH/YhfP family quinone oxidoreductase
MIFGTAGLTAALCIDKLLQNGLTPEKGKVIVTGATGGVGTMAVMILAKLGFHVVGVTGKPEGRGFLLKIGAKEVISREEVDDKSIRPLLKGIYSGCVDTVGGNILATILKSMQYNGLVAICGLVNSPQLPTSVFPFILRGVSMFGIDSSECDIEWRKKLWKNLAKNWKPSDIQSITKTVTLNGLSKEIKKILKGGQIGRVIVRL